jgi:hypothetical protein
MSPYGAIGGWLCADTFPGCLRSVIQDKNQALGSLLSWSLAGGEDSLKNVLELVEKSSANW